MKNLIELDSDYAETLSTVNQMGFYAIQKVITHPSKYSWATKQNNTYFYEKTSYRDSYDGWLGVLCAMPFCNTMIYKIITKKYIFEVEKISECWVVDKDSDEIDEESLLYPTNARFYDQTHDIDLWQYFYIPI